MIRVISIKYDVENDRLDKFDDYKKAIDRFYDDVSPATHNRLETDVFSLIGE